MIKNYIYSIQFSQLRIILTFSLCFFIFGNIKAQSTTANQYPEAKYYAGLDLMSKSNYGSAFGSFNKYLQSTGVIHKREALYNKAICALKLYHLDGEQLMQRFISDYPNSVEGAGANLELGRYYFHDRNYPKVITYLSKLSLKGVSSEVISEIRFKLGYSHFSLKHFNEAYASFGKLKNKPNKYKDISAYYVAYIDLENENYESVLKELKLIENSKVYKTDIPMMKATALNGLGRYDELVSFLEPLLKQEKGVSDKFKLTIILAETLYEQKKYLRATEKYASYYNKEKKRFRKESVYHYGHSLSEIGDEKNAIEVLKTLASDKSLLGTLTAYQLGQLYINTGNKLYALTAFKQVMSSGQKPIVEEAHLLSGKLAYELERSTEAINILQDFITKYPSSTYITEAKSLLSKAYLTSNNYELAIKHIELIVPRSASVRDAYQKATFHYGVELYNHRKYKEAVALFNKSLTSVSDKEYAIKAYYWIAESYSKGRRYEEAIISYLKALYTDGVKKSKLYLSIKYGLGYAYYNTKQYPLALTQYKDYKRLSGSRFTNEKGDAILRLADCYYVTKQYANAVLEYGVVINSVATVKDYALYQTGVIKGIQGEYAVAVKMLDQVINRYATSPYYDDAIFEKGNLLVEQGDYVSGVSAFTKLLNEKKKSPYIPFAIQKRAISNFNLKNYDATVADYKTFIDRFPTHKDANNVLLGLQEAMALQGDTDGFDQLLVQFKQSNPQSEGLQEVEFESVKTLFNNQEYTKSSNGFRAFLDNYPNDPKAFEARYLLGESLYRGKNNAEALSTFKVVLAEAQVSQLSRVTERIADLEFGANRYDSAKVYYASLKNIATNKNQELRALEGLMVSYYSTFNYDSSLIYGETILAQAGSRTDFIIKANLFTAKTYFELGKFDEAVLLCDSISSQSQDVKAAEAQYIKAAVFNRKGEFEASNEVLYKLAELYGSYTVWLDKAFLLISDNFISAKEFFQARATLQSIIDNSQSETTIAIARKRMIDLDIKEHEEAPYLNDSIDTDSISIEPLDSLLNEN